MQAATSEREAQNFLFVCGAARSGTTAVMTLLNFHPEIVLGVERYATIEPGGLGKDLYTKKRFFDFRPVDRSVHYPEIYGPLENKFSQARWIGDKVPQYYLRYEELFEKFPGCVVIFVLRDIRLVASSWNRKAANPADNWKEDRNYVMAVDHWNKSLQETLAFKKKLKNRLIVVEHEHLFGGDLSMLQSILARLNLDLPEAMISQFRQMTRYWERRPQRELLEYEGQVEYIRLNADFQSYKKLKRLAVTGANAKVARSGIAEASRKPLTWARSLLRSAR